MSENGAAARPLRAVPESETSKLPPRPAARDEGAELREFLSSNVLSNDQVTAQLRKVAERAAKLAEADVETMTTIDLDAAVGGTSDEKMIWTELQLGLAKYGYPPTGTVDSLVKLRQALVDAYRDNELVPIQTRLRAAELGVELNKVEVLQETVIAIAKARALTDLTTEQSKQHIARIEAQTNYRTAEVKAGAANVALNRQEARNYVDQGLVHRRTAAYRFGQQLDAASELRQVFWSKVAMPTVKVMLVVLVPLVLIANLVADDPRRTETPVLGTVNNVWDAMYMPVRDGVVRVFEERWPAGGAE
jgi:hypothetical protein